MPQKSATSNQSTPLPRTQDHPKYQKLPHKLEPSVDSAPLPPDSPGLKNQSEDSFSAEQFASAGHDSFQDQYTLDQPIDSDDNRCVPENFPSVKRLSAKFNKPDLTQDRVREF